MNTEKVKKTDYIKSNDKELNFYHFQTLERFGETLLGVQGEKHPLFKERMKNGEGKTIVNSFWKE